MRKVGGRTVRGGRAGAAGALLALLTAGCGASGPDTAGPAPGAAPAPAPVTTPVPAAPAAAGSAAGSGGGAAAVPAPLAEQTPAYAEPPGEPFELPWLPGAAFSVVGVPHDGGLSVHAAPGPDFPVVAVLDPASDAAVVSGRGWAPEAGLGFAEVTTDGVTGWALGYHLAARGPVDDVTSAVVARIGRPVAPTMADLGALVAEVERSDDPPSLVVMSVAPTVGDLGEVQYDVVGFGDDSAHAARLHVFGEPVDGGFALRTVERTTFCSRGGPTGGGLCP